MTSALPPPSTKPNGSNEPSNSLSLNSSSMTPKKGSYSRKDKPWQKKGDLSGIAKKARPAENRTNRVWQECTKAQKVIAKEAYNAKHPQALQHPKTRQAVFSGSATVRSGLDPPPCPPPTPKQPMAQCTRTLPKPLICPCYYTWVISTPSNLSCTVSNPSPALVGSH
mmetsp:Transcript_7897/g.13590  ORF Transcript_7897/g.13590 Transcript_7897/m.13590 type:complete len:167 (-) Transcript_7897:263-763(-)